MPCVSRAAPCRAGRRLARPPALANRGLMSTVNHTDTVRETLIAKLTYGEYLPGHAFKLRELVQDPAFQGMSQTPIREALLQLVAKDILVGQRGFSVRVPIPSVEHLTEVRAIRTQLEVMAAVQHLGDWTAHEIDELAACHQALMHAKLQANVPDQLRHNALFHMALCRVQERSYLKTMIQTLWAITGPSVRFLYGEASPTIFAGTHPHDEMLDALRTGDAPRLEAALVRDLSATGTRIIDVLRRTLSPEALTVQPFKPMALVRERKRAGQKLLRDDLEDAH